MNILPALQPILADLTERFEARIKAVQAPRPNEVYFQAQMELVPGFCAQLYKKWNGRLVSLFADDARTLVGQASRLSRGRPALGPTSAGETPGAAGGTPAPGVWTFSAGLAIPDDVEPEGSGTDLPPGPHALGR